MSLIPLSRKLTPEDAAHLLRRTAFGGTDAQIRALVGRDAREVARERLTFDQRLTADNPFQPAEAATPFAGVQLTRAAWLYELLYGSQPLREVLTLTWSNHFVVGTDKVRNVPVLAEYLNLLRRHAATTDFTRFALDVAQSPAMLRYLDADLNRKGKPNENFSRELLELFTTGIGPYTEKDVQEGARALTGWTFRGGRGNMKFLESSEFFFISNQHDGGRKSYLGQNGNLSGEDVVRIAASHSATATFVARKLHRAFVADTPDEKAVEASAETFRRTNGDIHAVLEELLASDHFYARRAAIIRGPVAYIVGTIRTLGQPKLEAKQILNLAQTAGRMGQFLLQPDTVKGWDGGREWVGDTALLLRMQLAASLTLGNNAPKLETQPTDLALLGAERSPLEAFTKGLTPQQRLYLTLISPEYGLA
ncbi:DUF1800 domain-containing protein [Deinococcus hopiensis]|uniref:Uncharacterized conserved protein, DUF1800 family n=1 Tax=Deinococcus hopiensis KR-140 TaxID=695939 RepID=A0A1W1U9U3_9DEIO|nr:DUF1800 domain-containing protein [Deinococcus hopiensis]SMB77856.1 Uncharacterized conserved protein, DUF1800 family [Deinococcus hopiensis KR-140]